MSTRTNRAQRRRTVGKVLAVVLLSCALIGCDDGVAPDFSSYSVELATPKDTLTIGETVQLVAHVLAPDGSPVSLPVTWTNESPATAVLAANGVVTAVAEGAIRISAAVDPGPWGRVVPAALVLQVRRPVAFVEITPSQPAALHVGESLVLHAQPLCSARTALDRPVAWSTSDAAVAAVSGDGVVTGLTSGVVTITAQSDGHAGAVHVAVVPRAEVVSVIPADATLRLSAQLQLTAVVTAGESVLEGRPVVWLSGDPSVAVVTAQGLVTAVAEGVALVTATSEGLSGATMITVRAQTASVTVSPPSATLLKGGQVALTATVRDPTGLVLDRGVVWTSQSPEVATVGPDGLVTAVAPGVAVVTAYSEGTTGSAVMIVQAPVAAVRVAPSAAIVQPDQTIQLLAMVVDDSGSLLQRPVTWSSADPAVATIDPAGLVTGVSEGTTTVSAAAGTVTGTASITVLEAVAALTIEPATALSLTIDESVQLSATPYNGHGRALERPITWSSSQPQIASVDASGMLTGHGAGAAVIFASAGEGHASIDVTVRIGVETVEVGAPAGTLGVGESMPLSVLLKGRNGETVTADVTWVSADEAIASVSAEGIVTGVAPGSVDIRAESEGKGGSTHVTVSSAVATIVISKPNSDEEDQPVMVGGTMQLTAELKDAAGNVLTDRHVTWSSSDAALATVDQAGLVAGVSRGTVTISAKSGNATGTIELRVAGSGSGGGGEEGLGNNLSTPVVFSESISMVGLPVTEDVGLRPTLEEGIVADANPFWYAGNQPDCGTPRIYYCQQGPNTWRAEWLEAVPGEMRSALVSWGDNLTHHAWNTHAPIRVEVTLYDQGGDMLGFAMPFVEGSETTEMQGTDGQIIPLTPTIYTPLAHLIIQKLENYDEATGEGDVVATVTDAALWANFGAEGPGQFKAEVNVGGRVIYGYSFLIRDIVLPDPTLHKYGWWRITFQVDPEADIGGLTVPRNLSLDLLPVPEEDEEELLFAPRLDTASQRTWLDIYVESASGGGGGGQH